jgi:GntR family transcriptional regulator
VTDRWTVESVLAKLREQIRDGTFKEGDRLPTVNYLVNVYGLSQGGGHSVHKRLRDEGLTISKPGSGNYVRAFAPIRRSFPSDFRPRSENAHGPRSEDELQVSDVTVEQRYADTAVAIALGLNEGDLVVLRTNRVLHSGRTVQVSTSYYDAQLAMRTTIVMTNPGAGGVFAQLTGAGHKPVDFLESLTSRMPTPEEVVALDELPAGTPVYDISRQAFDAAGRCVELTRSVLDAGSFQLDYSTPGAEAIAAAERSETHGAELERRTENDQTYPAGLTAARKVGIALPQVQQAPSFDPPSGRSPGAHQDKSRRRKRD